MLSRSGLHFYEPGRTFTLYRISGRILNAARLIASNPTHGLTRSPGSRRTPWDSQNLPPSLPAVAARLGRASAYRH